MQGYYTQYTAFEREGDKLFPVRIKREWVQHGKQTVFEITACEAITWQQLACRSRDVPDWNSNRFKAETRDELLASGVIRPAGDGMPFLSM